MLFVIVVVVVVVGPFGRYWLGSRLSSFLFASL
jgi:hypothetical protein